MIRIAGGFVGVSEKVCIFAASFSIEAERLIRKTQDKVFSPQILNAFSFFMRQSIDAKPRDVLKVSRILFYNFLTRRQCRLNRY